jgi:hypothetical protein
MSSSTLNDKNFVFINTKNKSKTESENITQMNHINIQRKEAAEVSDEKSTLCEYCAQNFPGELMFCTSTCLRIFRFKRNRKSEI